MTHEQAVERIRQSGLQGPAHGNLKRVREIVEGDGALIEAMNCIDSSKVDETPQGAAAHTHSREILSYLQEKGVKRDIFVAAAMGLSGDVAQLLKEQPDLARAKGAHGIPLIAHAADAATAQAMIDHGVDCSLFMSANLGLEKHAGTLIQRDPTLVNARNEHGLTALQIARMMGHKAVVKVLLEAGAEDPDGAGRKFLEGQEVERQDWNGRYFHDMNLQAATFNNVNLGRAMLHNINMSGAVIFNVNLRDAVIDWAGIDGLKICGVEVKPLIDAELTRRHSK